MFTALKPKGTSTLAETCSILLEQECKMFNTLGTGINNVQYLGTGM